MQYSQKKRLKFDKVKICPPDYMERDDIWSAVDKEGNYLIGKSISNKDIIQKLEDKTSTNDLCILDLFQLADYELNRLYTTAKDKNENVKVYNSANSEIKIYHGSADKVSNYPVVSVVGATHTANKIYKLSKALGQYK